MKIENKYTMWCTNCGKFVTIYADGVDNWADLVCTKCHLIIVTIKEKNWLSKRLRDLVVYRYENQWDKIWIMLYRRKYERN